MSQGVAVGLLILLSGVAPASRGTDAAPATPAGRVVIDAHGQRVSVHDTGRVVAGSGAITETVFALGAGNRLVGADSASVHPDAATRLPRIGYQRSLSAEGVLALRPSLVLLTTDAGPPAAIAQLRGAGVAVLTLPGDTTVDGARARIRAIAQALGLDAEGAALLATLDRDLAEARASAARTARRTRALFLYARGAGNVQVSGGGTAADAMIRLAGAENAVTQYGGYKPMSAEAIVAAAPDVVVMTARGLESVGGIDGLLALPGVAITPAGRHRRIIAMDDLYLLGFGPRTGQAARDLARSFQASSSGPGR
jgi:iron complex transport system substrate-binding protein